MALTGEVRCNLKLRDGWRRTITHTNPGPFLSIPFRGPLATAMRDPILHETSSIVRRDFRLVKSSVVTDHRTGNVQHEAWYEET